MSNEPRRDESVDQLLRTSMRDALSGPTTACVDAETLAAWADGALAARERERVEVHVSSCANCQGLAAAFARSMPEKAGSAAAVVPGFFTGWRLGWLAAVATAAAAVTIWVMVPRDLPSVPQVQSMASRDTAPAAPPLPVVPQAQQEGAATPPANTAASPARQGAPSLEKSQPLRREVPVPSEPADVPRTDAAAPVPPPPSGSAVGTTADKVAGASAAIAPPPSAPAIQAASGERSSTVARQQLESLPSRTSVGANFVGSVQLQTGVANPNAAAAQRRVGGADQNNFMLDGLSAGDTGTAVVAEVIPRSPGQGQGQGFASGGAGRGGAGGRGAQAAVAQAPSAPSSVSRWRILSNGRVERLMSNVPAAETVVFNAPVFVTAGSAPSALVCWLVGRAGAIALTTDAEHFNSVPFPEATDLSAVLATSAVDATVTTAAGAIYTTTNAGATWRRIGP